MTLKAGSTRPVAFRFEWLCDECGNYIEDGKGYLCVDYLEGRNRRVEWQALHSACDPNPDKSDYWFKVERIRTVAQLLDWNAHLHGKTWIRATNWDRFILEAAKS